jgi:hypothetical protein
MAIVESKKLTLKACVKWNIGRGKNVKCNFHSKLIKLKLQSFPQKQEEPCSALAKLHTTNQQS